MLWISLALVALLGIGITGVEAAGRPVSKNSRCGREFGGATCQGSKWGDCCSQYGYCGRTKDYCEVSNRCQQGFGTCSGGGNNIPSVSQHSTLQTSTRPSSSIRTSTASSPPSASVPSSSSVASSSSLGPSVPISQSICSVVTVTASAPDEVVTVTVPGDAEIITQISTLTASETIPVTLPVVTETLPPVTETLPAITVTLPPVTETLPAVTQTLPPVTDISITTTTTTLSPSTTTVASCPTGNPLRNGDFESGLSGSWSTLTAGDADVSRVAMSGGYALAARINVGNANLPQRVIQAISVCNSVQYQVSFQARRTTTAGVVSAVLYVNDTPLAGGIITSTAFVAVGQINGGIFSSAGGSSIVRLEFTFSGNAGTAKEVQVDNVVFTPV